MTEKRDPLAGYPDALRRSIEKQAAELKARQLAGKMDAGPWVPTTKLGNRKRPKPVTRGTVREMRRVG